MSHPTSTALPRILIIDDNAAIHQDFRKILGARSAAQDRLASAKAAIFGPETTAPVTRAGFRMDSAHQGQEALALVQKALAENDPYVLAFVDVRMPPGWDGVETLDRIWKCAPELQAVICTAYSDYSWDDMARRLGQSDNFLILKKPFENVEVLQIAHALTRKWTLARQAELRMDDLEQMVRQRTGELLTANGSLKREIEERTRVQEHLRASEERFSKAFQSSPIPMAIQRCSDRRFLDANASFIELSGHTIAHLVQGTDQELRLWAKGTDLDATVFSPEGRFRNQACLLRRNDGTARQVLLSVEPLNLGATPCLLVIVEDITDRLKLEGELRQAQKMEAVGCLAAGVAHEFNNILTVIQGDIGLLKAASLTATDRQALLDQAMQASQRAAGLTRQLLSFGRKQVLQPHLLDFSAVVLRMKKMLSRLISEKFDIDLRCANELPAVFADEASLEQILINLLLNARDAMPEGGVIRIDTGFSVLDETATAAHPDARAGRFVCLTVSDQGCGMSPEVLAHIFDPFFTTKDVGKGTGLGLPTVHGIVKQHEGWIEVSSLVGRGSTFKVFLPARDIAPSPPTQTGAQDPAAPKHGKGETVLVVEDELAVRELACLALEKHGYQVLKALDGPQALELWGCHSAQVDLLLTDMVMPNGMSGGELAKILQSRKPQLKVLYSSGYSAEVIGEDSLLARGGDFLPKPYSLHALIKAVRECLDPVAPAKPIGAAAASLAVPA